MLIFKKEKHVRKLVLRHLAEVNECLQQSYGALEEYTSGNLEEVAIRVQRVIEIESRADKLERQIREALLDGAFLPTIRSDVYRLVEAVDAIAGKSEDVARLMLAQKPLIPTEFESDLLEIFRQCLSCFSALTKAFKDYFKPKGKIESLHEHVNRVCDLETEVDRLEADLVIKVFGSLMGLSEKIHLAQLIECVADVADLSEDAADELEYAAMKSVV
jgi:predicted phosphate transport protein (TIGR00153 family)